MLISEFVAREKACPLSMGHPTNIAKTCQGSDCMAWRSSEVGGGFCGMAGRPLAAEPTAALGKQLVAAIPQMMRKIGVEVGDA